MIMDGALTRKKKQLSLPLLHHLSVFASYETSVLVVGSSHAANILVRGEQWL